MLRLSYELHAAVAIVAQMKVSYEVSNTSPWYIQGFCSERTKIIFVDGKLLCAPFVKCSCTVIARALISVEGASNMTLFLPSFAIMLKKTLFVYGEDFFMRIQAGLDHIQS